MKTKSKYYQLCVNAYFEFYTLKLGHKPNPGAAEFATLKLIEKKLVDLAVEKNDTLILNKDIMKAMFLKFLGLAYSDKWLAEHFNLFNLNKQFDIIISKSKKIKVKEMSMAEYVEAFNKWKS